MPDGVPLFGDGRLRVTPSGQYVALSPTTGALLDAQHALKQPHAIDSLRAPRLLDDIVIVADEQVLGLPRTEITEVRRLLAQLPLMPTLLLAAQLPAALHPIRDDPANQLRLATEAFSGDPGVVRRIAEFLALRDSALRYALDEQQLYVLARLTLEEARDEQTRTGDPRSGGSSSAPCSGFVRRWPTSRDNASGNWRTTLFSAAHLNGLFNPPTRSRAASGQRPPADPRRYADAR